MYRLDGTDDLAELELDHLAGYQNSRPVRIGNGSSKQLQLDIYGELLDAIYLWSKYGDGPSYEGWQRMIQIMRWLSEHWRDPDEGIWEVRGGRKEFLHSRLMCWVAFDRAIISAFRPAACELSVFGRKRKMIVPNGTVMMPAPSTCTMRGRIMSRSAISRLSENVHQNDEARTTSSSAGGLLRTVRDQRIAPALRLMHSDPGQPWHLEDLAKATAMSRTTFAMYFKKVAGVGPLTYLTEWRMRLAEHALRKDRISVSELAQSLGYTSDSVFSRAFRRVTGMAPKHYRIFSYAGNRREAQPRTDEHAFAAIERRAFHAWNVVLSRLGRGRGEVRCGLCYKDIHGQDRD
jgi:AraC-like DNA-binding protein